MIPGVWAKSEAACTGVWQLGDQFLHTEGSRADSVAHYSCSSTICMSPGGRDISATAGNEQFVLSFRRYSGYNEVGEGAGEGMIRERPGRGRGTRGGGLEGRARGGEVQGSGCTVLYMYTWGGRGGGDGQPVYSQLVS
jgi:hypothetical protein